MSGNNTFFDPQMVANGYIEYASSLGVEFEHRVGAAHPTTGRLEGSLYIKRSGTRISAEELADRIADWLKAQGRVATPAQLAATVEVLANVVQNSVGLSRTV